MRSPRTLLLLAVLALGAPWLCAQNEYHVDGANGIDLPTQGSSQAPWKTISYALMQIVSPAVPNFHTLHIRGGQTYSAATNGESFPIRLVPGVRLIGGDIAGGGLPVLSIPAGTEGLRLDSNSDFLPTADRIEGLIFSGGTRGISMEPYSNRAHCPVIQYCSFSGQTDFCIVVAGMDGCTVSPGILDCSMASGAMGVKLYGTGANVILRPEIDGCSFADMAIAGVGIDSIATGLSDLGGFLRYSKFLRCVKGVEIRLAGGSTGTSVSIAHCYFRDGADRAVHLNASDPLSGAIAVDSCAFVQCRVGVEMDGRFSQGSFSLETTNNVAEGTRLGFQYLIDGMGGAVGIVSRGNRVQSSQDIGITLRVPFQGAPALPAVNFESDGDRVTHGNVGMMLEGGWGTCDFQVRNGIFCGNTNHGIVTLNSIGSSPLISGDFLTVAGNQGYGIQRLGAPMTRLGYSHCVVAGNSSGDVSDPMMDVTWSCTSQYPYTGMGNIHANPLLDSSTYKLRWGSPCIDAGDPNWWGPGIEDYEGDPRALAALFPGWITTDMGADEFAVDGSVHTYGVAGHGREAFRPRMSSSSATAQLGGGVLVELADARDRTGSTALGASLMVGLTEGPGFLPFDLAFIGASGSFLWQELWLIAGPMPITPGGSASVNVPIPSWPYLAGLTLTAQWLLFKPLATDSGLVTSDALRVTLGR